MPTFFAPDGTRLAYRIHGDGNSDGDGYGDRRIDGDRDPVVCIPGGPADSRYLGDLGGLSAHRRLIVLDLRGTGRSAIPDDTSSYRCDRLVEDVEALRTHLGLPGSICSATRPERTSRRSTRRVTRRTSAGSP